MSLDFFYTKADGDDEPDENTPDTVLSLVMVCSQTGYISCVPLQHKNQLDLMNRELVQFVQRLGHSECNLRCDNEPATFSCRGWQLEQGKAWVLRQR